MIRKLFSLLFFASLLFAARLSRAQGLCGFDKVHDQKMTSDPGYKKYVEDFDRRWSAFNSMKDHARYIVGTANDTTYEIPVVVHVISPGGAGGTQYNPTDAQIIAWINYLNQVYSATYPSYPDSAHGGAYFPIRFALAKRTPACDSTSGIVRVDASSIAAYVANGVNYNGSSGVAQSVITGLSRWDPDDYYNIYVVNKFDGANGTSGTYLAGFAYYAGASNDVDGAFMLSQVAVAGNSTLPHEMGHALGLIHTFDGSSGSTCPPNNNCTTDNDKVCDTEPGISLLGVYPCPTGSDINPCTGAGYKGVQYNIMNYTQCPDRFTPGQRDRAVLQMKSLRMAQISSIVSIYPSGQHVKSAACVPSAQQTGFDIGPANVSLADMRYYSGGNYSDGGLAYIDNSCTRVATVRPGMQYPLTVTTLSGNQQSVVAYIDYNNDGSFAASELVMSHPGTTAPETHTGLITIPTNAVLDTPLRMRVLADFYWSPLPSYCSSLVYGQGEDFGVIISSVAPLAIVLKSITATAAARSINVNWATASESDVNDMIVERSTDGRIFSEVAFVRPNGFASVYNYNDDDVASGMRYYYRLHTKNKNGTSDYSKVVAAMLTQNGPMAQVQVYPNPGGSEIKLKVPVSGNWQVQMQNLVGQTVLKQELVINEQEVHINVPEALASGVYYLLLLHKETGQQYNIKWMKQ